MQFKYTLNENSDNPIMLIDKHIGFDEIDGEGIMGDIFQRELNYLDSLGKENIEILINSPGGVVTDGYQIYSSIRAAKTNIKTHCIGLAASIAAVILQAGDERIVNDYSIVMVHNASGGTNKSLNNFNESIIAMIERTGLDKETISKLMKEETWINGNNEKYNGIFWDSVIINTKAKTKVLSMCLNNASSIIKEIIKENMNEEVKEVIETVVNEVVNEIPTEEVIVENPCNEKKPKMEEEVVVENVAMSVDEMVSQLLIDVAFIKEVLSKLVKEEVIETEVEPMETETPMEEELPVENKVEIVVENKVETPINKTGVNILDKINAKSVGNTMIERMAQIAKNK